MILLLVLYFIGALATAAWVSSDSKYNSANAVLLLSLTWFLWAALVVVFWLADRTSRARL